MPNETMPMRQRQPAPYHHGDLHRGMLQAAGELLAEHGLEHFTLRECARRAGVSHGAPAHHFGDARGLLTALAAESFDQLVAGMLRREAAAPPDAFSQLIANGQAYVAYALAHRARFQLMFRSDSIDWQDPALAQAGRAAYTRLQTHISAVSGPGTVGKTFDAKVALAWSIVHGLATLTLENQLLTGTAKGREAKALALLETFLRMARPGLEAPGRVEPDAKAARRR